MKQLTSVLKSIHFFPTVLKKILFRIAIAVHWLLNEESVSTKIWKKAEINAKQICVVEKGNTDVACLIPRTS